MMYLNLNPIYTHHKISWHGNTPPQCHLLCSEALLSGTTQTAYKSTQIAKFMGWGPPGSWWPQMGPMLAPWTLLSWKKTAHKSYSDITDWKHITYMISYILYDIHNIISSYYQQISLLWYGQLCCSYIIFPLWEFFNNQWQNSFNLFHSDSKYTSLMICTQKWYNWLNLWLFSGPKVIYHWANFSSFSSPRAAWLGQSSVISNPCAVNASASLAHVMCVCTSNSLWPSDAMWWQRSGSTLAWWHRAITWTNVEFSSLRFCGIPLKTISLGWLKIIFCWITLEIIL